MNIIQRPLQWHKKRTLPVSAIIVHYNSRVNVTPNDPYNVDAIINELDQDHLSYHYLIGRDENATIYQLVAPTEIAYHAGYGNLFGDPANPNYFSIGISFVATPTDFYPQNQLDSFSNLVKSLRSVFKDITLNRIVGHSEVDPLRKQDPGPNFPWSILDKCAI